MKRGVLVLGHGSRAKEAYGILKEITRKVKQRLVYDDVCMASLQFSSPSLEEGIENMAAKGVNEPIIVPMFIFKGNHVKEDIPEILERLKSEHKDMMIVLADHIGADQRIADILIDRINEVGGCI